ncbi:MAG: aminopeptidase P family protein [Firmicutes bacterium]|nr:aminopeptidase P family protein [Bacillota bacterium]
MDKLKNLRDLMRERGLDAYIISSGDAHNNARMADYWLARSWFSGFTGSAGTVVVTLTEAGLWTDGRYFIQGENELAGTGITLFKLGEPDVPTYEAFLLDKMPEGGKVGFDGRTMSTAAFNSMNKKLDTKNLTYLYQEDLVGMLWTSRPPMLSLPVFEHLPKFAGLSAAEKLRVVREKMKEAGVSVYLVSCLDDIAWLLNIRGRDVSNIPVVYSYVLITDKDADVFIDPAKVADISGKLISQGFTVNSYEAVADKMKTLPTDASIYFNKNKTNILLGSIVGELNYVDTKDIIAMLKGVKSEVELANIRNAYIKEGAAMTKLLKWLDDSIKAGKMLTEDDVANELVSFRKQQEYYLCDSFETISAYGENAALPHYKHKDSGAALKPKGFFLLDAGGQYLDGTTDTTRTVVLGPISDEMKHDFTLVLKGHIALSRAVFLKGTTGVALDMLARQPLMLDCQNYNHGTGHGIGYCLNVHEGPYGIHQRGEIALEPGMITANEPGIYKQGRYGIRTENTIATQELCKNENGTFYNFETLTYCPYDTRAINVEMLTREEKDFVNNYHAKVLETLSPRLDASEQEWLKERCAEI